MTTLFRTTLAIFIIFCTLYHAAAALAASPQASTMAPPAIYGGDTAEPGDWPWMVALIWSTSSSAYSGQFCGGTLIHEQWVLTAAHCVDTNKGGEAVAPADVDVSIGAYQLTANDGARIRVTNILLHPDFDIRTGHADLALLQLAQNVESPALTIASVDDLQLEEAGTTGMVLGWGRQDNNQYTDVLRQLSVPLIGSDECRSEYDNYTMTDGMLCAGYDVDGLGTCSGDSGGPLVVQDESTGNWTQVGVVSWADGCAQASRYTVYTRVSQFASWIDEQFDLYTQIDSLESPEEVPAQESEDSEPESSDEGQQATPNTSTAPLYLPIIRN